MRKKIVQFFTERYDKSIEDIVKREIELKQLKKQAGLQMALSILVARLRQNFYEFFIIILADPGESFIILKKRDEQMVCSTSYVEYRLYTRKMKLLSLGGISTVTLATLMVSFIVTFLAPNLDVFAATYNFTQSDWRGGADTNATSGHTAQVVNSTAWTKFYSANSALVDTATSSKMTLAGQAIVVGDSASDFSAAGMSINFTEISGTGAAGKVILKIADGTQCDTNGDGTKDANCS